jgi:hypothetical protein
MWWHARQTARPLAANTVVSGCRHTARPRSAAAYRSCQLPPASQPESSPALVAQPSAFKRKQSSRSVAACCLGRSGLHNQMGQPLHRPLHPLVIVYIAFPRPCPLHRHAGCSPCRARTGSARRAAAQAAFAKGAAALLGAARAAPRSVRSPRGPAGGARAQLQPRAAQLQAAAAAGERRWRSWPHSLGSRRSLMR